MSFLVKIISEDHTKDQFILKPLIEKILDRIGKPHAVVDLVTDPKLNGFSNAMSKIESICKKYNFADLIIFLPDNDCIEGRKETLMNLEIQKQNNEIPFFVEIAIEEVEIWLLAGHTNKLQYNWGDIRSNCLVKEQIFKPFLNAFGNDNPGGGRKELMRVTLNNFNGLLQRCPELSNLKDRLNRHINA